MRRVAGLVLMSFGLVISLGDAFAPHRWLPIPLVVLGVGGGVLCATLPVWRQVRVRAGYFGAGDFMLVGFVGFVAAGILFSGGVQGKNLHHALAYTAVVLLFGFFLRILLAVDSAGLNYRDQIYASIAVSTLLVSGFAVLEFADANLLHLGISSLVPFPAKDEPYSAQFFIFTRARGFEAESGFLALYLNIFVPVSYIYVRGRLGRTSGRLFLACGIVAFLTTFSAAGLAALFIGVVVAAMLYAWDRRLVFLPVRDLAMGGVVALMLSLAALQAPEAVRTSIWSKLTLATGFSAGERVTAWRAAMAVAQAHPILGVGVGRTSAGSGSGVISFYLTMLKEAGGPALLLILFYFAWIFHQITRFRPDNPTKYVYVLSLTAAVVHYAVITNIWYPWIWLLCALILNERVNDDQRVARPLGLIPSRSPARQLR